MERQKRCVYIDIAKAYGILAIISWHIHFGYFLEDHYFSFFVLPLFFFLSGMFAKKMLTWKEFWKKELERLVIPLLFYTATFIACFIILSFLFPNIYSIPLLLRKIVNPFHATNGPLWFLWALLFIDIIYQFSCSFFPKRWGLLIAIILFFIGFYMRDIKIANHALRLPFMADTALTSYLFYYVGHLLKPYLIELKRPYLWCLILSLGIYIILSYFFPESNGSFFQNYYPAPLLLFFFLSFTGIGSILLISKVLEKWTEAKFVGQNTITFLGLHYVFCKAIGELTPQIIRESLVYRYLLLLAFWGFIAILTHWYIKWMKQFENKTYQLIINKLLKWN